MGAVNIFFQNVDHTDHLLTDGSNSPGFDSQSRGLLIEFDYALTDQLSITAGIPYVGAKYIGPEPGFFGVEIDDCFCWNHSFQDLGLTARYNLFGRLKRSPSRRRWATVCLHTIIRLWAKLWSDEI